jgi:hypothetical protein
MLGFAVVDSQPGSDATAVWLTSRVAPDRADHTNAVTLASDDSDQGRKFRSLVADRIVLLTPGSEAPCALSNVATIEMLETVTEEIELLQSRIVEAVANYSERTRSKNLVRPTFDVAPSPRDLDLSGGSPALRALATANLLGRLWTCWLRTEEQRRRRSFDPKKGTSPWIMPDDMSAVDVAELPPSLSDEERPQPVSAC